MRNMIYFENGIKHDLTEDEIAVIRKGLLAVTADNSSEQKALATLTSLFLEHLD